MHPSVGFPFFLTLTVVLLALDVWTGLRRRRRLHLALVATTLASLALAIVFAERLGELYDLEAAGRIYPFHLAIAKLATAAYLLPIATGVRLLVAQAGTALARKRRLHLRAALFTIALTLLTALTGSWMLLASEPLERSALDREPLPGAPATEATIETPLDSSSAPELRR